MAQSNLSTLFIQVKRNAMGQAVTSIYIYFKREYNSVFRNVKSEIPTWELSGGILLHGLGAKEKSVPKVKILEPTTY